MNDIKPRRIYQPEFKEDVSKLVDAASIYKSNLFRSRLNGDSMSQAVSSKFITVLNAFIDKYEENGNAMQDFAAEYTPTKDVWGISYSDVKDYIFGKYDWIAMIQFLDGVIKGLGSQKFTDADDIHDFAASVREKAFGEEIPEDVAGMIDVKPSHQYSVNHENTTMFKALKNHKFMNSRERVALTKAIDTVLHTLESKKVLGEGNYQTIGTGTNAKIIIAMVNDTVDFVIFTVAAYAFKVFMIGNFVGPFAMDAEMGVAPKTESVDMSIDEHTGEVAVMRNADEAECKDLANRKKFIGILREFALCIGATSGFDNKYTYAPVFANRDNKFFKNIMANEFFEKLNGEFACHGNRTALLELNVMLKSLLPNGKQGLSTSSTPKHEIFADFRAVDIGKTVKEQRDICNQLIDFTDWVLNRIEIGINNAESNVKSNIMHYLDDLEMVTAWKENYRMLRELYSEMAYCIIQKARDIENAYNQLSAKGLHDQLHLNLPNDRGEVSRISDAIPDTERVPIEMTAMYALPSFESMQMYDEAVKLMYGLENDFYYSEAFDLSGLMNQIQAFIDGIIRQIAQYFGNKNRQAAIKWVNENGDKVLAMNFTGQKMYVYPFKDTVNLNGMKNLVDKLSSFNDNVLENHDSVKKFADSLYPSATVASWFDSDPKGAVTKLRNSILYQDENTATNTPVKQIEVQGADITKQVQKSIDTIKGADTIANTLNQYGTNLKSATNNIKSKIANLNTGQQQPATDPGSQNSQDNATTKVATGTQQERNDQKASNANLVLTEINKAIHNLYNQMIACLTFCIDENYKQIKNAYTLGSAQETNAQGTATNAQPAAQENA